MSGLDRQRLRRGARRALLAALLVSAAASVAWYARLAREGGEPAAPEAPAAPSQADMVTRDFKHVETRMDRTIWVLEARKAEVQEDKARLNTVRVTWYGEPGSVPVLITSNSGHIDFAKRSAVLNGSVRLEREDGAVLETERLSWDEGRKVLKAPGDVVITSPTFTFRGSGMVADLERQRVRLEGRVDGEVRGGLGPAAGRRS